MVPNRFSLSTTPLQRLLQYTPFPAPPRRSDRFIYGFYCVLYHVALPLDLLVYPAAQRQLKGNVLPLAVLQDVAFFMIAKPSESSFNTLYFLSACIEGVLL